MPRAHDPRNIGTDRLPANVMGGPIPDQGWSKGREAIDDPVKFFIEGLLQQIKDVTGIDLFWLLDWSWTTNTIMDLVRQANDLFAWLQNPIQRPPNLLTRPGFSSPSAIAEAADWFWDAVVSLGTVTGPDGLPKTDPQGSARTTADGQRHALMSNAISDPSAVAADQILTCQIKVLVEDGFTASDDQAIRLEVVPSRKGVLGDAVVLAHCGVPDGDPSEWIAAPAGSKAAFFDVDYQLPTEDVPDTVELRVVVSESAGGDVPVRFDGARVAAAGGFLVVLADLFDAGRQYLTDMWAAIEAWLADMSQWDTFKTACDDAWAKFVKAVKRALRHADADSYVPPSTSGIISDALKNNPWFGWLFQLVDDWLEPVLKIGKACTDFGDACWQAVSTFVSDVSAPNAWQTMVSSITTAWDLFIRAVFVSWGATEAEADSKAASVPSPATATEKAIKNNPVVGWVFDLQGLADAFVDVAKAAWDSLFGTEYYDGDFTDAWNALMDKLGWSSAPTKTIGQVGAATANKLLSGIWQPIGDYLTELPAWLDGLNTAFGDLSDALWDYLLGGDRYDGTNRAAWSKAAGGKLEEAWQAFWAQVTGQPESSAPTPGSAGAQGLWNGISSNFMQSALNSWVHSITDPIGDFFDTVRKYINQMIEGLHIGYFDDDWQWHASLTTPTSEKPGSDPVMTPGRNDDDDGNISSHASDTIPAAPTGLVAVPWWDLSVSGFPAGTITYAIAAVDSGVEGPATKVSAFAGTLIPPNTNGRVDLAWGAVSGADSYRIYRKVDATYEAQDWRLVGSPTSAGTLLSPYHDKTPRSGGTVAHPKTDAELAAQIVTEVKSTASTAKSAADDAKTAANTAKSTASAAQTAADNAQTTADNANSAATLAVAKFEAVPEANIVIANIDPDVEMEDFGVELLATGGDTLIGPAGEYDPNNSSTYVEWTQEIPDGAILMIVTLGINKDSSDASPIIVADNPTMSFSKVPGYQTAGPDNTYWARRSYIASVSGISQSVLIRVGISDDSGTSEVYLLDACCVVCGGTASGDFDVQTAETSTDFAITLDAPQDSLIVAYQNQLTDYESGSDYTLTVDSSRSTDITESRSVANLVCVDDGAVMSSILSTKNVDAAESVTVALNGGTTTDQMMGVYFVVKSVARPQVDTIGSYAEISTSITSAFTQTVGSFNPFVIFNESIRYSPDITVDASTASFTVEYIGTYQVDVDLLCNETHDMTLGIAVNGTIVSARRCTGYSMTISTLVYAKENDVISLQVKNNASGDITLDTLSRMAISLVNRSYL